jgi:hypothetical protein
VSLPHYSESAGKSNVNPAHTKRFRVPDGPILCSLSMTEKRSAQKCWLALRSTLGSRLTISSPNSALNRTAQKLRFWVPSALRAPAAG